MPFILRGIFSQSLFRFGNPKNIEVKTGTAKIPTVKNDKYKSALCPSIIFETADEATLAAYRIHQDNIKIHYVGQKKPNELGIYDMSGNVWEWCNEWYLNVYYWSSPNINPFGPETGTDKVLRGGSFMSLEEDCRVSCRYKNMRPDFRYMSDAGLRVVLPIS